MKPRNTDSTYLLPDYIATCWWRDSLCILRESSAVATAGTSTSREELMHAVD